MKKHSLGSMISSLLGMLLFGFIAVWGFSGFNVGFVSWFMIPLGKLFVGVMLVMFAIPFFIVVAKGKL